MKFISSLDNGGYVCRHDEGYQGLIRNFLRQKERHKSLNNPIDPIPLPSKNQVMILTDNRTLKRLYLESKI